MQMKELYLFWGRLFHITWRELSHRAAIPAVYVRVERHFLGMVETMILAFD